MPRKLLRVALVAAVIPALTPVMSFAQTTKPASTARQTASTPAPKQTSLSWWQRLRGQKPAATTATKAPATKAAPSTKLAPGTKVGSGPSMAANKNKPLPSTKLGTGSRPESQSKIRRVSAETPAAPNRSEFEQTQELLKRPLITPTSQATAADFENAFPDDKPTTRRGRPVAAPQAELATPVMEEVATPVAQTEIAAPAALAPTADVVAAPVETVSAPATTEQPVNAELVGQFEQPEAYPIDSAAPPQDLTAGYNEPQGTVPQYDYVGMLQQQAPTNEAQFANPVPARPVANAMNGMNRTNTPVQPAPVPLGGPVGFARLDGGLYPSPQPHIPLDVGTTMITNPALDPHEMLYAHRYRGLYGPFYYKTYRHWVMTPFGICKNERRVLVGTEVRVNYKTHICPWSLYFPPVTH